MRSTAMEPSASSIQRGQSCSSVRSRSTPSGLRSHAPSAESARMRLGMPSPATSRRLSGPRMSQCPRSQPSRPVRTSTA